MNRFAPIAAAVVLMLLTTPTVAPSASTRLESTRALVSRLARGQRAEAAVVLQSKDPLSGETRRHTGTLALESPHFARLDFTGTGERLALREDGGDWLQPELKQLLRGGPAAAGMALEWAAVLREDGGAGFREKKLSARAFELTPVDGGETQRIDVGADGLPSRIAFTDPNGEPRVVTLSRWRFAGAKGRAGYVLQAPAGYEVVELP